MSENTIKMSRSTTECMCVNEKDNGETVQLQGVKVTKVKELKCLGSTVQGDGGCGTEVKRRVQAGWNGWRVARVICDRRLSASAKRKFYKTVVRPAMLYGLETVQLTKNKWQIGGGRVEVEIFVRSDGNGRN